LKGGPILVLFTKKLIGQTDKNRSLPIHKISKVDQDGKSLLVTQAAPNYIAERKGYPGDLFPGDKLVSEKILFLFGNWCVFEPMI
jgi:hypothetical protein